MSFEMPKRYRGTVQSLNVIPFVDILFLLIIFFSLMGQLLETEAPAVLLPDGCDFAVAEEQMGSQVATVTLIRNKQGGSDFAVGAEKVTGADYEELSGRLAGLIVHLSAVPTLGGKGGRFLLEMGWVFSLGKIGKM